MGVYREQEDNSSKTVGLDLRKVSSDPRLIGLVTRWLIIASMRSKRIASRPISLSVHIVTMPADGLFPWPPMPKLCIAFQSSGERESPTGFAREVVPSQG